MSSASGVPDGTLESAPCPLGCASDDEPILEGQDRLHGLPGRFTVVRCRECGLMRTNPRPSKSQIHLYYPSDYQPYLDTRVDPTAVSRAPARRPRFDPLNHAIPPLQAARMLEIGCGSGKFLQEMAAQGWQVTGLEPSESAGMAARQLGFPVHVDSLENVANVGGPYELIAGWMVLEHLHDPVSALRKLHAAASANAWLAVSVPDAGSWEFRFFTDAWYALQVPTHLLHFTPRTLERVLGAGGWRMERVVWQRDAKNLFHSLRYRCLDRGWTGLARLMEDLALGRRGSRWVRRLARLLAMMKASGRMTVWARRIEAP